MAFLPTQDACLRLLLILQTDRSEAPLVAGFMCEREARSAAAFWFLWLCFAWLVFWCFLFHTANRNLLFSNRRSVCEMVRCLNSYLERYGFWGRGCTKVAFDITYQGELHRDNQCVTNK